MADLESQDTAQTARRYDAELQRVKQQLQQERAKLETQLLQEKRAKEAAEHQLAIAQSQLQQVSSILQCVRKKQFPPSGVLRRQLSSSWALAQSHVLLILRAAYTSDMTATNMPEFAACNFASCVPDMLVHTTGFWSYCLVHFTGST